MREEERHLQRRHAAHHEAAHAVLAYYFGWWLNGDGVEIDERQNCGLRRERRADTERAYICVSLAGWGAEMRLAPDLASPHPDDELVTILNDLREEWFECEGDDQDVFKRLLDARSDATDEDLLRLYRVYEADTAALLSRADVWAAVQRVAEALLDRGKLTDEDVVAMLPESVMDGAFAEEAERAARP